VRSVVRRGLHPLQRAGGLYPDRLGCAFACSLHRHLAPSTHHANNTINPRNTKKAPIPQKPQIAKSRGRNGAGGAGRKSNARDRWAMPRDRANLDGSSVGMTAARARKTRCREGITAVCHWRVVPSALLASEVTVPNLAAGSIVPPMPAGSGTGTDIAALLPHRERSHDAASQ
jgi:hypothetical protein